MITLKTIHPILFFALLFSFKGYAQNSRGTNDQQHKVSGNTYKGNVDRNEFEKIQVNKESVQPVKDNFKPGSMQSSGGADTTKRKTVFPEVKMRDNLFDEPKNKEILLKE